jgi:hypothetical protein
VIILRPKMSDLPPLVAPLIPEHDSVRRSPIYRVYESCPPNPSPPLP